MNKRCIWREDAIAAVHEEWDEVCNYDGSGSTIAYDTECAIDRVPAADVRPVVRGEWRGIGKTGRIFVCSACDKTFPYKTDFCPNCGADMR